MVATENDERCLLRYGLLQLPSQSPCTALPATRHPNRVTRGLGEEEWPHHEDTGLPQSTNKLCLFWVGEPKLPLPVRMFVLAHSALQPALKLTP